MSESPLFCFANYRVLSFELCYAVLTAWVFGRWLLGECCRAGVIFSKPFASALWQPSNPHGRKS